MAENDCFYCAKNQTLRERMIEVAELSISTLYLNRDQTHRGRCILACKRHVKEFYELSVQERSLYAEDAARVATLLNRLFHPDKINYGIYGDIVSHLHIHLVPKSKLGPEWGDAFENSPLHPHFLLNEEYERLVRLMRECLETV